MLFGGMFWEVLGEVFGDVLGGFGQVFGRKKLIKHLKQKTYKITLLIPIPMFAVLIFYFFTVPPPMVGCPVAFQWPSGFGPSGLCPPCLLFRNDAAALPPRHFRRCTCNISLIKNLYKKI